MITMQLNGMAWVGNIYQKFEAMCLEVEENMYQDTVKYVENQVQTVGSTVKKFYSNVLEDISASPIDPDKAETVGASVKEFHTDAKQYVPPSTTDPVKAKASDSSLKKHADIGVYKMPRLDIKAEIKQSTQVSNTIADAVKDVVNPIFLTEVPSLGNQSSLSSTQSVKRGSPVSIMGKHNDGGNCKSNLRMKEDSTYEEPPSSQTSGVPSLMQKELEVEQFNPEEGENFSETVSTNECTADVSLDFPPSDKICLVEFAGDKEMEMRLFSSGNTLAESNDTAMNDMVVYVTAPSVEVSWSCECVEEVSTSETGSSEGRGVDGINIGVDVGIEPEIATVVSHEGAKLEESCVLVDAGNSPFVSQKGVERKSYKKKIRNVFSSKAKPARKQEYKRLALQYREVDIESNQQCTGTLIQTLTMEQPQKLKTVDLSESEWEVVMPL